MGWFSKKEEVPEIAPMPTLPKLPQRKGLEKKDLLELPSFPNIPKNENLNQEIVKSAVTYMPSPEENKVSVEVPMDLRVTEEPQGESLIPPKPFEGIPEPPKQPSILDTPPKKKTLELNAKVDDKPITKQIEPIFVRIDKFQLAQKNFEQIKGKVKEIELVLGKIKDIKLKEEIELKGWTEDIEKIKSRLSEVDADIFDQV